MTHEPSVWPAQPRQTVQVRFDNGATFEGPIGTPLEAFIEQAYADVEYPIAAALVDNELESLTYRVTQDVSVKPISTSMNDGMRVYQRSVAFLLVVAVHELFPEARVIIDHSVTLGGFFCQVEGRPLFSEAELKALDQRMRQIVAANEPIIEETIPVAEAVELFEAQGYDDKVRLLAYSEEEQVTVYSLRGVRDYFYGFMMPSTALLCWFGLERYPPGMILRLPNRLHPTTVSSKRDYPKLMGVLLQYKRWLNILNMEDVGSLNAAVEDGRIQEVVLVSEALHEKQISDIADDILNRGDRMRLVLIAGPSSSGKTTFARRLAIQIMVNGMRPYALGLDDYFVDREHTPRDEEGGYDFEALEAIDLPLFNQQLVALLAGETVRLPRYNFKTGKREWRDGLDVAEDTIFLVEGIHGLNPRLLSELPPERVFRVYVSALTQLNIDHHNRVPTTDTRLLRRIVRDAQYRGYSAKQTIERWESVRRGEERNIFPHQENADVMFNSALVYELGVLRPFAEPLLLRVPQGTMEWIEARRLLAFLRWFRPCAPDLVPDNSLLREFIGGSRLREFTF